MSRVHYTKKGNDRANRHHIATVSDEGGWQRAKLGNDEARFEVHLDCVRLSRITCATKHFYYLMQDFGALSASVSETEFVFLLAFL